MWNEGNTSDLRGLLSLMQQGASQVTDVVEDLHQTIAAPFDVLGTSTRGRTGGITGLVYRSIQGGYRLAGGGLDAALRLLPQQTGTAKRNRQRELLLSHVNGIVGDYLAASGNPLSIEMSLRSNGRALVLEQDALQGALPTITGKILLLVHGLCMNDLQWTRSDHDHGQSLAEDLGYTPIYLHYNSGAHISTNGRRLAALLEQLVKQWPLPVASMAIVCHSMGGLVARSACHYGAAAGHAWPDHLDRLVFLGTPHHGSPWERIGAWTSELPRLSPYIAPFDRLQRVRSAGITDLRHGSLLDEDWSGSDRFARAPDRRQSVPLPAGVAAYAIAASLGSRAGDAKDRLLGDGLVQTSSALGLHSDGTRDLGIPPERRWIAYNTSHLALLGRADIYTKLSQYLREPAA